ncbi:GumC family protein, partial [Myxococcota bacterium]
NLSPIQAAAGWSLPRFLGNSKGVGSVLSQPANPRSKKGLWLSSLWRFARQNQRLILPTTIAGLAGAGLLTSTMTPIYRAQATLQIDPSPPPLGGESSALVTTSGDSYLGHKEYFETQYKVLTSRRLATAVVQSLRLQTDSAFLQNLPAASLAAIPPSPGQSAEAATLQNSAPSSPKSVPLPPRESAEAAANILLSRFNAEPVKHTRLVSLSLEDANPQRAERILAALVDTYLQRNLDDTIGSVTSAAGRLRHHVKNLKANLESSELALHSYRNENTIVSPNDQSSILRDEMQRINQALTDVRVRREHLASRSRELAKVDPENPLNVPSAELLASSLLTQLRSDHAQAKAELAGLSRSEKANDRPTAQAAQARVSTTRKALLKEIVNIQGALKGELAAAASEAYGLSRLFEAAKQKALEARQLEFEYRQLERAKSNNEKVYSLVLEKSKENELKSMLRWNNIRLIDEPFVSARPVKPRLWVNLAFGLVAGLGLGFALAFVKERVSPSNSGRCNRSGAAADSLGDTARPA